MGINLFADCQSLSHPRPLPPPALSHPTYTSEQKIKSEDENLKMAIDINDTDINHRPVSKTAQHGFDESPTIPAPLSPSLYCGAQVCGQEYCLRSLFCFTIHFSSPAQPLPNFRLFSF